jgi:trypsin
MKLAEAFLCSQLLLQKSANSESIRGVGGKKAPKGRYPYAVHIEECNCGGSLIAPDVVLSAAHCHCGGEETISYVTVGCQHLDSENCTEVEVQKQVLHPQYDSDFEFYDFMMLFLNRSVDNVDHVQVGKDVVNAGTKVAVLGWGDFDIDPVVVKYAKDLMEVDLVAISNEECFSDYQDLGDEITNDMLCAEEKNHDSCEGDSGGPLVIRSDSGDVQVGVVSWGELCASPKYPGVYCRVSDQYEWIKTNVCGESSAPPSWFECESDSSVKLTGGLVVEEA